MFIFDLQRFTDGDMDAGDVSNWNNLFTDGAESTDAATNEDAKEGTTNTEQAETPAGEKQTATKETEAYEIEVDGKIIKVPKEKILSLRDKIKVDGEEVEISFGDMKPRAQMGTKFTQNSQANAETKKQLESEKIKFQERMAEWEASKINSRQETKQSAELTAKQEFKQRYGEDYVYLDEDHADKMQSLVEERASRNAVKMAEASILQRVEQEQLRRDQSAAQKEMVEIDKYSKTEPSEVLTFAMQSVYSLAQSDPGKFDEVYPAMKKFVRISQMVNDGQDVSKELATVTHAEAKAFKDHLVSSRKDYYGATEKPGKKEMRTESTESSSGVDKKLTAADIRVMSKDESIKEFDKLFG